MRQANAALEEARTRENDSAFLTTSDEENASGPEGLQCEEPLTLEAEEEMRRMSELRAREQAAFEADLRAREQAAFDAELLAREQAAFDAEVEQAAADVNIRSTPVSAHAYGSPSVQRLQFDPIASEEEGPYDSGAEWGARRCGGMPQPPPYDEVTQLQPLAAWDARREAERAGMGAYAQQPSFAYAPGQYSGEPLHDRAAARGGGPLDAHQPSNGEWRAHQEIPPDQLRRTAPEASVHAHAQAGATVGR